MKTAADYELIRSDRRTLCLEITRDGRAVIRAPRRMSEAEIDAFAAQHAAWIAEKQRQQALRLAREPDEAEKSALREAAKAYLLPRTEYFSRLMGVRPASVKITAARTRFGSCSSKNAVCFSLFLMQYPREAVDYVIVHELAHITHHNHSRAFYRLIAEYLPDYRERQRLLRTAPPETVFDKVPDIM